MNGIDNRLLTPPWRPDSQIKLEEANSGKLLSPDWVKSLIIAEISVEWASDDGQFSGLIRVLDHYAEMGVNGLWLTPINEGGHYANFGPYKANPQLTGTDDFDEGWNVVKDFIGQAHQRNIRVFIDIVTWGTHKQAPIYRQHPEWYMGKEAWGGWAWDWENAELREWFTQGIVDMALKTGVDGFRCDCEPEVTAYDLYADIKSRLLKKGRKIALISEIAREREETYDFEQLGIGSDDTQEEAWLYHSNYFSEHEDMPNCVRTGRGIGRKQLQLEGNGGLFRFYSSMISCHDSQEYWAKGRPYVFGYNALFAPFIPIWMIGEEWNNPFTSKERWAYANIIDWDCFEQNRSLFESVKKMICIRRQNTDIFEYSPQNHRETNICRVVTNSADALPAYARYGNGRGILVVPNAGKQPRTFQVVIPYEEMSLSRNKPAVLTDLMSRKVLSDTDGRPPEKFSAEVKPDDVGVYEIRPK